ncbi:MAG: hypothetical protein ACI8UO_006314, partial [Verrucomicrobiales bacterium]
MIAIGRMSFAILLGTGGVLVHFYYTGQFATLQWCGKLCRGNSLYCYVSAPCRAHVSSGSSGSKSP